MRGAGEGGRRSRGAEERLCKSCLQKALQNEQFSGRLRFAGKFWTAGAALSVVSRRGRALVILLVVAQRLLRWWLEPAATATTSSTQ